MDESQRIILTLRLFLFSTLLLVMLMFELSTPYAQLKPTDIITVFNVYKTYADVLLIRFYML